MADKSVERIERGIAELRRAKGELEATNEELRATNEELEATNEELKAARDRYSGLVNNIGIAIFRNTPGPKGHFIEVNPAFIRMFEAGSREGALKHSASEFYPDPNTRKKVSDKIVRHGFIKNEELELMTLKGRKFWALTTVVMRKDKDGNAYFDGVVEDITERKKAGEALAATNEELNASNEELKASNEELNATSEELKAARDRYSGLVNNIGIGVFRNTPGPKGHFIEANPAFIRIFEAGGREELMKHSASELYQDPSQRKVVSDKIVRHGFIKDEELELVTLKGRKFWALASVVMKKGRDGDVYFDGIVEDITKRKRAELALAAADEELRATNEELKASNEELEATNEELKAGEEKYRRTLDNMMEGCQIIGRDWRYRYVNDVAATQGRVTKKALLGRTMMEVYPGIEKTAMFAALRLCMKRRILQRMENEFAFPDGTKGWFGLSIEPSPEGVLIMSQDVTERKRAEVELAATNEELRATNEELEATNEELKASNEELNATNEELRATNEELEATNEGLRRAEREIAMRAELLDAAADAIYLRDENGRFIYANKAACALHGYSRGELLGLTMGRIVDRKNRKLLAGRNREAMRRGELTFESTHLRKDGSAFPVEVHMRSIAVGGKKLVLTVARDITQRKMAEEALAAANEGLRSSNEELEATTEELRATNEELEATNEGLRRGEEALTESEKRYRDFVEKSAEMVQSVRPDGSLEFVNCRWREVLGYGDAETRKMKLWKIIHPSCMPHCRAKFMEVMAGRAVGGIEAVFIRKDGGLVDVEGSAVPRMAGGKVIATQGFFMDITERKKAEDALRESEAKYRLLFSNMQLGVARHRIVLDKKGRPADYIFLEVNKAFERLTGLKAGKILNRKVTEALPGIEKDPADWIGTYGRVAITGKPIEFEQHSEALGKWYKVSAYSSEKGYFTAVFSDITALRDYDKKLEAKVVVKTKELTDSLEEQEKKNRKLEEFKEYAIGRENEIIALRKEVKRLRGRERERGRGITRRDD